MKKIFVLLIGIIMGVGITAGATLIYSAFDIEFSSANTTKTNVGDAIEELYDNYNNLKIVNVTLGEATTATSHTFDATSIPNYQKLTADNFKLTKVYQIWGSTGSYGKDYNTAQEYKGEYNLISYDATTGIVTVDASRAVWTLTGGGYHSAYVGYTLEVSYINK